MALRWQSMRAAVVKSSTWCTVRTTRTRAPASRTRAAARAEMQSWVWKMSTSSAIFDSPASRSSIEANTRFSKVSAGGEAGTSEYGARTGRKKSWSGLPSATMRTGIARSAIASASDRVCTTPPRALVE